MALQLPPHDAARPAPGAPPIDLARSTFGAVSNPVHLVLCMIVRNEAAVIERCLDSALPHVDGYVVCDTGSTDDTVRIVEQSARRHGVSGLVVQHEWRNFGHNRTLSAGAARAWAEAQGWSVGSTYLLHLDADMALHVDPEFDRRSLTATSYDVIQEGTALRYWNVRLTRLSHEWSAVGATHEYWQARPDGASAARLGTMRIQDFGDGGSRGNKFERDVELLLAELEREPDNPRHTFYLAQTYYDLGRWQDAADWYERRRQLGGWDEERWYAGYRQGLSLLQLGESDRGTTTLLEAFEERPSRAEPLWALAHHYREQGKNQLALLFARRGLELPYPDRDALFLESEVYDWRLWEEVMISAWYAGAAHHALGLAACERLISARGHEPAFYPYVASNEVFYTPLLEAAGRGTFGTSPDALEQDGMTFRTANPSIARWRNELYVNLRLLNYEVGPRTHYSCLSPDGIYRSYNALHTWTPEEPRAELISVLRRMPPDWPETWARGLEDVRMTVHDDRIWFTATCCQVPGAGGVQRVVLGRLSEGLDAVEHLVPLSYAGAGPAEKNWLPWSVGDELRLIYSYDPFVVLGVDAATGQTTALQQSEPPFRAADFRGACAPIPFPDGSPRWLAVVHLVVAGPEGRVYSHRWIEIEEGSGLTACSAPFTFDHTGIEYAAGLAGIDDQRLVVTYGFEDREARWVECRWQDVIAALHSDPRHVENREPAPFDG